MGTPDGRETTHSAAKTSLGDLLIASGALTPDQLDISRRQERHLASLGRSVRLEELLVRNRFTTPDQIHEVLARDGNGGASPHRELLLSPAACSNHQVVPISAINGVLTVKSARAISPVAAQAILNASSIRCQTLRVICADAHEMHAFLSRQLAHDSFESMLERLRSSQSSATLVRMAIEALLHEAIDLRVSDIHMDLKPEPDSWVALRIDGELKQSYLLNERLMAALCSRIKTLAGMDASNSRTAQGGRLELDHRTRMVGFRVATQPLVDGESLSIRILDAAALPAAQALFPCQPEMMELMNSISEVHGKSGGLMLVTGPTGSGKSTTLYTIASKFPRDRFNLITVENPVEYVLPFIRQIQLQDLLGEQATDLERNILRQDPDVLIFGEIRDAESARAALKFAESGHFVLSTLHSQSAGAATERLMSMIPESDRSEASFVVATTLKTIINQRLFKRLCQCAVPYTDAEFAMIEGLKDIERALGANLPRSTRHAVGCTRCKGSGYRGRVAVHETLVFAGNEKHRDALAKTLTLRSPVKGLLATGAVRMISQVQTVTTLLREGLMDILTANIALNVHEVVADRELSLEPPVERRRSASSHLSAINATSLPAAQRDTPHELLGVEQ
jgi:type II secretory ATPase GspE/PulE/Tfp pilus assembly ATPase PilB-like protein